MPNLNGKIRNLLIIKAFPGQDQLPGNLHQSRLRNATIFFFFFFLSPSLPPSNHHVVSLIKFGATTRKPPPTLAATSSHPISASLSLLRVRVPLNLV